MVVHFSYGVYYLKVGDIWLFSCSWTSCASSWPTSPWC